MNRPSEKVKLLPTLSDDDYEMNDIDNQTMICVFSVNIYFLNKRITIFRGRLTFGKIGTTYYYKTTIIFCLLTLLFKSKHKNVVGGCIDVVVFVKVTYETLFLCRHILIMTLITSPKKTLSTLKKVTTLLAILEVLMIIIMLPLSRPDTLL